MAEMTTVQPQAPAPAPAPAQGKPPLKKKGAQKKKMAKRLIALAVAAAVCLGGGFALHRFLNSGSGDLGEIYAQPASIGSIQSTVSGSGTAKAKETALAQTMVAVRERFGKNAVLTGTSLLPEANARERNLQIGGHRA